MPSVLATNDVNNSKGINNETKESTNTDQMSDSRNNVPANEDFEVTELFPQFARMTTIVNGHIIWSQCKYFSFEK